MNARVSIALTLGILGVFCFHPLAPFALALGYRALRKSREDADDSSSRRTAKIAVTLGCVGTVLLAILIILPTIAATHSGAQAAWTFVKPVLILYALGVLPALLIVLVRHRGASIAIGVALALFVLGFGIVSAGAPLTAFVDLTIIFAVCCGAGVGFLIGGRISSVSMIRGAFEGRVLGDPATFARAIRGARVGALCGSIIGSASLAQRFWQYFAQRLFDSETTAAWYGITSLSAVGLGLFWAVLISHLILLPIQTRAESSMRHTAEAAPTLTDDSLDFWILAMMFLIAGVFMASAIALG